MTKCPHPFFIHHQTPEEQANSPFVLASQHQYQSIQSAEEEQ